MGRIRNLGLEKVDLVHRRRGSNRGRYLNDEVCFMFRGEEKQRRSSFWASAGFPLFPRIRAKVRPQPIWLLGIA
jgi:hypothetical protein